MNEGKSSTGRSRAAHLGPERRRPQILDAALELVVHNGARGVSMESVAQKLDVSRPVIYACFGSRDELLAALLDREAEKLLSSTLAALPATPDWSRPRKVLEEGFAGFLESVEQHADSWRMVFAAAPDPAVAKYFAAGRRQVRRQIGELMKTALGLSGAKDVERKMPVLVEFFMATGESAVRLKLQEDVAMSAREMGSLFARLLYGALRNA